MLRESFQLVTFMTVIIPELCALCTSYQYILYLPVIPDNFFCNIYEVSNLWACFRNARIQKCVHGKLDMYGSAAYSTKRTFDIDTIFGGSYSNTYFFRIFGWKDYIPCDSYKVITGIDIWFSINLMYIWLWLHCQSTHPALDNTIWTTLGFLRALT